MRTVVVLGAGATGSLFGARLAASGDRVVLVGRPEHVRAIRENGLVVEGVDPGTFRLEAATGVPEGIPFEAALVTVKSFDLEAAASALARALPPTPTGLLGNGLGIEAGAVRALRAGGWSEPEAMLVRAVHTVPATLLGPGRVRASGTGEVVFPTPESAGPAGAAVRLLTSVFAEAHFAVRSSPTFPLELWRKAAVNAAVNPVTALRRVPNGALRDGRPREEARRLLEEAVAVARAEGVDLPTGTAVADLERVVEATADNRSSMLQDVERGRPTELDAISGEILRRARARGVAVPATASVVERLRRAVGDRARPAQR